MAGFCIEICFITQQQSEFGGIVRTIFIRACMHNTTEGGYLLIKIRYPYAPPEFFYHCNITISKFHLFEIFVCAMKIHTKETVSTLSANLLIYCYNRVATLNHICGDTWYINPLLPCFWYLMYFSSTFLRLLCQFICSFFIQWKEWDCKFCFITRTCKLHLQER